MCNETNITDPEIKKLCEEIVAGQKREIEEIKSKLEEKITNNHETYCINTAHRSPLIISIICTA
jgi:hypothetical protein